MRTSISSAHAVEITPSSPRECALFTQAVAQAHSARVKLPSHGPTQFHYADVYELRFMAHLYSTLATRMEAIQRAESVLHAQASDALHDTPPGA